MLESIYVGLTGLTGYSKGLNNVSNNIANLNTPGFKSTQLQFADLFYDSRAVGDGSTNNSQLAFGSGLKVGNATTVFTQGELRQTGNDQDAAIDGGGFFVLRKDGEVFYTRAGQFEFDENGFLVSRSNGARVSGLAAGGGLRDINVDGYRATPGKATSIVQLSNNLSTGDSSHQVSGVSIFDALGGSSALSLVFTNNNSVTPRSWLLQISDPAGNVISNGEIRFGGDGSPAAGFNAHTFSYTPSGAPTQTITLNFGEPGTFSGATNFSAGADSTLQVSTQDGFTAGALSKISFDEAGFVVTEYSNGQNFKRDQLALASFSLLSGLEKLGNNLFANSSGQTVRIGAPGTGVFGDLSGGQIELSNVDLSGQFTDLIVIQRGFQASSQLISTSNEMIQQLLDMGRGK